MNFSIPGWHAWLLIVPLASIVYDLIADAALWRWMSAPEPARDRRLEPVTFFRPLKAGVPRLREKLEMQLRESLAGDQIIFGVDAGSEEEAMCEEVRRAFPEREVHVVRCLQGRAANPKISRLMQMAPLARHDSWLVCDSEMIFGHGFLEALRGEWQEEEAGALTTAYRFANVLSWPQRCDAMGVLLGLWPGLAVVRRYGRVEFTLGACTLFRRQALVAIGGWEAFGQELAEDQRLGAALVKAGHAIRLSRQVATLDSDAMSWGQYWRHQRRVAVTYRAANPAGFAGMALTFGPVWSILGAIIFWRQPWLLLAVLCAVRSRQWRVCRASRWLELPVTGVLGTLLVASFVEAACWVLSWFSRRVWWSGRWWRVSFGGRFSP